MLKSTHRTARPLPPSWTEHEAPNGHHYYYNSDTKKSTYTRPTINADPHPEPAVLQDPEPIHYDPRVFQSGIPFSTSFDGRGSFSNHSQSFSGRGNYRGRGSYDNSRHSRPPDDRPKSKHAIPDSHPWLLIKTRLGRRFVHNPSTNESFWKIPQDLVGNVVEFDIQERERRERANDEADVPQSETVSMEVEPAADELAQSENFQNEGEDDTANQQQPIKPNEDADVGSGSDEYEEVEVTDDELDEEQHDPKRQKLGDGQNGNSGPVELGEDDMAYQLAQMGESYDLDPGEYGDGDYGEDWEEGAEGLPVSAEEASASFKDILDDLNVNPFSTWDGVMTDNRVVEDDRYTLLTNMKARKEVFAEWSATKIQALKQFKDQQVKQNPRISYLAFIEKYATPKLYWPEFKRRYKRESELKDTGLSDKEREKLYREHITRTTKNSEETLKNDLEALLRSIPPSTAWNRSTSLDGVLSPVLLTDIRFISVTADTRDQIIRKFIATLPSSHEIPSEELSHEESQKAKDREKREMALKERGRLVGEAKRQQEKELLYGQRILRDEEIQLQKAMKISKGGLRENLNIEIGRESTE